MPAPAPERQRAPGWARHYALPAEARARAGIGYVPQVSNVFPSLTIRENLEVVQGVSDRRQRIDELFSLFPAIAQRAGPGPARFRVASAQQLAFARALMTRPRMVCSLAPTAALSPFLVEQASAISLGLPALARRFC